MKKIFSWFKSMPNRISVAIVATVLVAITVPTIASAWGPTRDTYTVNNPAPKVTFDSITDNPNIGDERNFVSIRETGSTGAWQDSVTVQPGQSYVVRMYVHNDAASSLNLVAHNVTAKFDLPTNTAQSINVFGYIDSSNADPTEVYDQATFNSSSDFNLAYQTGTLEYTNNVFTNGIAIPESVFTSTGALLGYNKMDGNIPGCFQYSGYLTFTVKPQFASPGSFTTTKQVRELGSTTWQNSITAKPGDTLQYELGYANTGQSTESNVTMQDTLPKGINYVAGSTILKNGNYPNGTSVADGVTTPAGINIGTYNPEANAYVIFNATVASNDSSDLTCGPNTLTNTVKTTTSGVSEQASADVDVTKTCTPPVTPVYTCNALTASLVSGTTYNFNGSASASNGASIVGYSINFGDGNSSPLSSTATNISHTYATQATGTTYTATLNVTFRVNGANTTVSGSNCSVIITVGSTPECKPGIPVGDSRCTTTPPPVTPPELPHTGASADVATFLGLGSLVASVIYYVRSRRLLV